MEGGTDGGAGMSPMGICLLCTGNICRSPFAEGLLRVLFEERGAQGRFHVTSAGTMGLRNRPAEVHGVACAAAYGVDLVEHRSRGLSPELVGTSGLVLAMSIEHVSFAQKVYPEHRAKVFLFGSFPQQHLAGPEIEDPIGQPLEAYRAAYAAIDRVARRIVPEIMNWQPIRG